MELNGTLSLWICLSSPVSLVLLSSSETWHTASHPQYISWRMLVFSSMVFLSDAALYHATALVRQEGRGHIKHSQRLPRERNSDEGSMGGITGSAALTWPSSVTTKLPNLQIVPHNSHLLLRPCDETKPSPVCLTGSPCAVIALSAPALPLSFHNSK